MQTTESQEQTTLETIEDILSGYDDNGTPIKI